MNWRGVITLPCIISTAVLLNHSVLDEYRVPPKTTYVIICSCLIFVNSLGPSDKTRVRNLTIIGSDNGLSPGRRQVIVGTNVGILLNGPLETNFKNILIEILTVSFKKMRLKVSSAKRRSFCLRLNVSTKEVPGMWFCTRFVDVGVYSKLCYIGQRYIESLRFLFFVMIRKQHPNQKEEIDGFIETL